MDPEDLEDVKDFNDLELEEVINNLGKELEFPEEDMKDIEDIEDWEDMVISEDDLADIVISEQAKEALDAMDIEEFEIPALFREEEEEEKGKESVVPTQVVEHVEIDKEMEGEEEEGEKKSELMQVDIRDIKGDMIIDRGILLCYMLNINSKKLDYNITQLAEVLDTILDKSDNQEKKLEFIRAIWEHWLYPFLKLYAPKARKVGKRKVLYPEDLGIFKISDDYPYITDTKFEQLTQSLLFKGISERCVFKIYENQLQIGLIQSKIHLPVDEIYYYIAQNIFYKTRFESLGYVSQIDEILFYSFLKVTHEYLYKYKYIYATIDEEGQHKNRAILQDLFKRYKSYRDIWITQLTFNLQDLLDIDTYTYEYYKNPPSPLYIDIGELNPNHLYIKFIFRLLNLALSIQDEKIKEKEDEEEEKEEEKEEGRKKRPKLPLFKVTNIKEMIDERDIIKSINCKLGKLELKSFLNEFYINSEIYNEIILSNPNKDLGVLLNDYIHNSTIPESYWNMGQRHLFSVNAMSINKNNKNNKIKAPLLIPITNKGYIPLKNHESLCRKYFNKFKKLPDSYNDIKTQELMELMKPMKPMEPMEIDIQSQERSKDEIEGSNEYNDLVRSIEEDITGITVSNVDVQGIAKLIYIVYVKDEYYTWKEDIVLPRFLSENPKFTIETMGLKNKFNSFEEEEDFKIGSINGNVLYAFYDVVFFTRVISISSKYPTSSTETLTSSKLVPNNSSPVKLRSLTELVTVLAMKKKEEVT